MNANDLFWTVFSGFLLLVCLLAGLSDQALTRRLVPAASNTTSGANGRFPIKLQKLIDNHLATSERGVQVDEPQRQ